MKALVLYGPGDLRLESVPKPAPKIGSVVVKVIVAPVWDYLVGLKYRQHALAIRILMKTVGRGGGRVSAISPGVPTNSRNLLHWTN